MALHVMDEARRCLGCPKPRCQEGCPIKTDIPTVIKLLKAGLGLGDRMQPLVYRLVRGGSRAGLTEFHFCFTKISTAVSACVHGPLRAVVKIL